ncbi:hypothetical protein ACTXT7_005053 [Hymenolepis weldensis]
MQMDQNQLSNKIMLPVTIAINVGFQGHPSTNAFHNRRNIIHLSSPRFYSKCPTYILAEKVKTYGIKHPNFFLSDFAFVITQVEKVDELGGAILNAKKLLRELLKNSKHNIPDAFTFIFNALEIMLTDEL